MTMHVEFDGKAIKHPRGAWGNRTHSGSGEAVRGNAVYAFNVYRYFDKDADPRCRVTYDVELRRKRPNGRGYSHPIRSDAMTDLRLATVRAFKGKISELLAEEAAR